MINIAKNILKFAGVEPAGYKNIINISMFFFDIQQRIIYLFAYVYYPATNRTKQRIQRYFFQTELTENEKIKKSKKINSATLRKISWYVDIVEPILRQSKIFNTKIVSTEKYISWKKEKTIIADCIAKLYQNTEKLKQQNILFKVMYLPDLC